MTTVAVMLVTLLLLVAGCGGTRTVTSSTTSTVTTTPTITSDLIAGPSSCNPAPGHGHMGVCVPKPQQLAPRQAITGQFIPDTYEGNGCKDWTAARGRIAGGIVKAFEYRSDSCLAAAWRELTAARMWHAAYDFLRPSYTTSGGLSTSDACQVEADRYVTLIRSVGGFNSGPAIADAEVPLPAGFVACWVARVKHDTGMTTVVVYTAPGTWPGGGNPGAVLWVASYGAAPGCVWTCGHVAWQFTDGVIGPDPHCTAVGCGDVSLDTGLTSLLASGSPGPADIGGAQHYERDDARVRHFGRVHARERNTIQIWDRVRCANPARRAVCRSSRSHMQLLLGRDQAVYRHQNRRQRDANHTPGRIQGLVHRLDGRGHVTHWL